MIPSFADFVFDIGIWWADDLGQIRLGIDAGELLKKQE